MTNTKKGLQLIPWPAWAIAGAAWVVFAVLLTTMAIPKSPATSHLSPGGMVVLGIFAAAFCAAYVLLIGYIYGDAKRRGMRYVLWTLLAIFIPDAIGVILYFIIRDPLPRICPGCGSAVKADFTFCPRCATSLRPTCPQCGRAMDAGWLHCPNCGAAAPRGNSGSGPATQPAPL